MVGRRQRDGLQGSNRRREEHHRIHILANIKITINSKLGDSECYPIGKGELDPSSPLHRQSLNLLSLIHQLPSPSLSHTPEADLTSLLSQLQSQSSTIQETQTNSLLSRKKLAEQTREFKKQSNEFQLENLKPLLKSYQTEIDELTKRSKSAESGFLGVLNKLGNVKDPLRCLEVALVS